MNQTPELNRSFTVWLVLLGVLRNRVCPTVVHLSIAWSRTWVLKWLSLGLSSRVLSPRVSSQVVIFPNLGTMWVKEGSVLEFIALGFIFCVHTYGRVWEPWNLLCKKLWFHLDLAVSHGQTDLQIDASFGLAFSLRFVWPPTCNDLCGLALTLVELKFGCK